MHVDSTPAPASTRAGVASDARRPTLNEIRATQAAQDNYERHRAAVLSGVREKLRRVGADAPHHELDAGYNLAWNSLISLRASGTVVESEIGWLITTTYRRVIDWLRLEHHEWREKDDVESDEIAELLAADEGSLERHVDQQRQLRSLLEAFRHRFTPRETLILFYAYVLDMPRAEIARKLDIPLKRLHKLLDGYDVRKGRAGSAEAVRAHGLKDELAKYIDVIASGDWCSTHGSLIRAHALGWFEPGSAKHTAATTHLKGCPACRQYFQAKRGIAMLLPPVTLPVLDRAHSSTLLDPFVGVVRTLTNMARSALGISGSGDAAVVTGTTAGGTAVAGTLLGGAGAKLAAVCVTLVAGVCIVTGAIPTPHAATRTTQPSARARAGQLPSRQPANATEPAGLLASTPLLAADLFGLAGSTRHDFGFENQGGAHGQHPAKRHRATPAATQTSAAPSTTSTATTPRPSTTPEPTRTTPGGNEFGFEH